MLIFVIFIFLILEIYNKSRILPSGNFAVPAHWVRIGGNKIATLWGFILGMGVITYQAGTLFHTYILLAVFSDNILYCILSGGIFGFMRAIFSSLPFIRRMVYSLVERRVKGVTALTFYRRIVSLLVILATISTLILKIKEVI